MPSLRGLTSVAPAPAVENEQVRQLTAELERAREQIKQLETARDELNAKLQEHRRSIFFRYINEVSQCLEEITGKSRMLLVEKLKKIAEIRTEILLREGEAGDEKLEEVGDIENEDSSDDSKE